jgi:phage shock protein PspC (stress-responsive transcriptional regulator)
MKRVYRSRHTKVLGGVAAGLADYFGMDVTIMRLLFALLLVTVPNVIIAYILAWIIIPEEPEGMASGPSLGRPAGDDASEGKPPSEGGMTADEILRNSGIEPSGANASGANASGVEAPKGEVGPVSASKGHIDVPPSKTSAHDSGDRSRQFFGFVLIAVGAVVLLRRVVPTFVWRLPLHLISQGWPVLIIIAGIAIILGAVRGR